MKMSSNIDDEIILQNKKFALMAPLLWYNILEKLNIQSHPKDKTYEFRVAVN